MSGCQKVVTPVSKVSQSELPPEFIAYALIVSRLNEDGVLGKIAQRLRLDRNKGYQGIDLVLVLLAYFCARLKVGGLRKFLDKVVTRYRGRLAGIGGREKFPSQGSASRMFKVLTPEQVAETSQWLLHEAVDYAPLIHHPSVKYLDCQRETWDIFDFDITATVLRQRGVAEGQDLPEVERISDDVAAPGRTGRKRGHMKISRATVQHRGSRLWVDAQLAPGNGSWPDLVAQGFEAAQAFAAHQKLDLSRSIMCIDGEGGGHPQMRCGLDSPFSFVTRLTMYAPLKKKLVQTRLSQQHWQMVSDSGSGPQRQATEYGTLELSDGHSVRLVVTRFRSDQKRGAGICIDGWHYEVFATDLPRKAFEAADVVWVYHGRCGQENYFSLEDRELGLDHLFSKNLAGQHLANVVGLWLWNLEILNGVWACGGLPDVDHTPHQRESVDEPIELEALKIESSPLANGVDRADFERSLIAYDWAGYFADKPGFEWDEELGRPICATGEVMELHRVVMRPSGNLGVYFRIHRGPCRGCLLRQECTSSTDPKYRKGISVTVPLVDGDVPLADGSIHRRLQWRSAQPSIETPPLFEPFAPILLPQKLRQRFEDCCHTSRAILDIERPPLKPDVPEIYAMTAQHRQRRRRRWEQRIGWNKLDDRSKVTLTLLASPELQRYLEHSENPESPAVGAVMR